MRLKNKKIIEYYTDGALRDTSRKAEVGRMGIGWIVKEEGSLDRNISLRSSIENWSSSTRAELGAIWLALLTTSYKAEAHIFTDSKAAIEAIERSNTNTKTRNWLKSKNKSIIRQIKSCCKAKDLNLILHKVKGHSGNKWNDQADRLAKEGINKSACLNVPEVIDSNLLVVPRWRGLTIESPLRSFINIVSATTYETEWANLSKVAEVISHNQISNSDKDLNWKFMWNSLKKCRGKNALV